MTTFLRNLLQFTSLTIVLFAGLGYWYWQIEQDNLLQEYQQNLASQLTIRANNLQSVIADIERDVHLLSQVPPIQGIAWATAHDGIDPRDGSSLLLWQQRLAHIFHAYAANREMILQVRYIGVAQNGAELVRVERNGQQFVTLPPQKLQPKGGHDYFTNTIALPEHAVYISPVNLNREHGVIQLPEQPTLRIATPVYYQQRVFGLVIVNIDANQLLQILKADLPADFQLYMADQFGSFILHPDKNSTYASDRGASFTWQDEFNLPQTTSELVREPHSNRLVQNHQMIIGDVAGATPYLLSITLPNNVLLEKIRYQLMLFSATVMLVLTVTAVFAYLYRQNHLRSKQIEQLNATLEQQITERTAQLQYASDNYARLVEEAPIALLIVNKQGIIERCNALAEEVFGYKRTDLLGQPVEILLPPAISAHHPELRQSFFAAPSKRKMGRGRDLYAVHKSGRHFPVEIGLSIVHEADGVKAMAAITNIEQRKEVEQERQRLVSILTLSPDAVCISDMQGNLHYCNSTALNLTGRTESEIRRGLTLQELQPQDRANTMLQHILPYLLQHDIWRGDSELLHKNGHRTPVSQVVMLHRDQNDEPAYLSSIMRDMTAQNKQLAELKTARQAAEQANIAKSAFIANMSHEIRTPMNAVLGMLQLMQKTPLNERQHDYISKAGISAKALLAILNDILDFSKMEAGRLQLEQHPFALNELLRNIGIILAASVGSKAVEIMFDLAPDLPQHIIGDELRLQQVLLNLMGNAVKFTEQGQVVLRVKTAASDLNTANLTFEVEDSGIGISKQQWQHIFQGFAQAEASTTRRYGGTGLGLAISKHLTELMGGTLSGDSTLGKGSRFYFTLPFSVVASQDNVSAPASMQNLSVLIADDNPVARDILQNISSSFGWRVKTVNSGFDALQILQQATHKFDVLLLDWQMPGMNGIETCEAIKALPDALQPRLIIMVTAYEREMVAQTAEASLSSLSSYLVKPITPSMLFDAVASKQPTAASPTESAVAAQPLLGCRILLVEDNPTNQLVASELLREAGAEVTTADNGELAVTYLRSAPLPDLVLMDIQMPVMDGYEATQVIRQQLNLTNLPIIAMTANALTEHKIQALAAGMNAHIAKPIELQRMLHTILQWLPSKHTAATLTAAPKDEDGALQVFADKFDIDLTQALNFVGGNAALYKKALQSAATFFRQSITELTSTTDVEVLQSLIHNVKGTLLTLAVRQLSQDATSLDLFLQQQNTLPSPELLDKFIHDLQQLQAALTQLTD